MVFPAAQDLPEVAEPRKVAAVGKSLPHDDVVRDSVEVFKALANPVRLSIIHALAHEELSVGDLAHVLGLSLSVASHQLALLRRLKLVSWRDEGRLTFYRTSDAFVSHLVHDCLERISRELGLAYEESAPRGSPGRRRKRRSHEP